MTYVWKCKRTLQSQRTLTSPPPTPPTSPHPPHPVHNHNDKKNTQNRKNGDSTRPLNSADTTNILPIKIVKCGVLDFRTTHIPAPWMVCAIVLTLFFGTCLRRAADLSEDSEGILLRISFPAVPQQHLPPREPPTTRTSMISQMKKQQSSKEV